MNELINFCNCQFYYECGIHACCTTKQEIGYIHIYYSSHKIVKKVANNLHPQSMYLVVEMWFSYSVPNCSACTIGKKIAYLNTNCGICY